MQLTLDEQLKMMKRLVPEWAIQTDNRVAHGKPWVPHEYVTHMLDTVFGPDCWSFEVGAIKPITLPNNDQLIYVPGKMTVRFADGSQVVRSDVGIGLVQAKIDSPDLSDLGIDSFETGYKSRHDGCPQRLCGRSRSLLSAHAEPEHRGSIPQRTL